MRRAEEKAFRLTDVAPDFCTDGRQLRQRKLDEAVLSRKIVINDRQRSIGGEEFKESEAPRATSPCKN